jgi:hypothetical protein
MLVLTLSKPLLCSAAGEEFLVNAGERRIYGRQEGRNLLRDNGAIVASREDLEPYLKSRPSTWQGKKVLVHQGDGSLGNGDQLIGSAAYRWMRHLGCEVQALCNRST